MFYIAGKLSEVVLVDGLPVIGEKMFDMISGNAALVSTVIPISITSIGNITKL